MNEGQPGSRSASMSDTGSVEMRPEYHALVRTDVFPLVPHIGGTLLDLGGGIGATAAALKAAGHVERAGVVDLVSQDPSKLGLDFHYTGDLERSDILDQTAKAHGPFSVVLCLDILEHLVDPWRVVKQLHATLAPGGVIVASIPNMRYYKASFPLFFLGRWNLEERGIRDRTHLRWFVKDSAVSLMTSSGLVLEEVFGKPSGGRKIKLVRAATLNIFNEFTNLQYLVRVRNQR